MESLEKKLAEQAALASERKAPRTDPAPRARRYTIVSVDDHVLEPPDLFEGRLPRRFATDTPKVARGDDGADYWLFDHERVPLTGGDAFQTWERGEGYAGPVSYDDVRPGSWDVRERVRDMDINGVAASLNF